MEERRSLGVLEKGQTSLRAVQRGFARLVFEEQVMLVANVLTICGLFFPWVSAASFREDWVTRNAFSVETWFFGVVLLVCAGVVTLLFAQEWLFRRPVLRLRLGRVNAALLSAGLSVLILLGTWATLFSIIQRYAESELRFGIAMVFVCQVMSGIAAYLLSSKETKKELTDFFHLETQ